MSLGYALPFWSIIPFVGMLLSIALLPLLKGEWWEKHQLLVSVAWSMLFLVPFTLSFGVEHTAEALSETIVGDYVPFIVLLLGLFVVSGGIHIKGAKAGTTGFNVCILLVGTTIASWVGTTGAAMLLIRPLLRANSWRTHKAHIVIFFIILVANIGGCLTPLGDPPLFLGYLRGVPFFWTMEHIWPILLLNVVVLIAMFVVVDRAFIKKEPQEALAALRTELASGSNCPIRIEGWHNFFFIGLILTGVVLNGLIPSMEPFVDASLGITFGVSLFGAHVGIEYVAQIVLIGAAAVLSWATTPQEVRKRNDFEWAPIAEVARLFIGIFITMIPALELLRSYGGALGVDTPMAFFWASGVLSSFLDNSPTYVVFLTMAGALGAGVAESVDAAGAAGVEEVATSVGAVDPGILLAISAGAVFMGALTYIGNAPNFMVKNIAETSGVKMPTFFGYIGRTLVILIPVFALDSILFFL